MNDHLDTELTCEKIELLLSCYCDGEADDSEVSIVESHLSHCQHCQTRLATFETINGFVNGNFDKVAVQEKRQGQFIGYKILAGLIGMAACIALIAFILPERPSTESNPDSHSFVEDAMMLTAINLESEQDQSTMIRTLEMDLRALGLEMRMTEFNESDDEILRAKLRSLKERLDEMKTQP